MCAEIQQLAGGNDIVNVMQIFPERLYAIVCVYTNHGNVEQMLLF